MTRRYSRIEKFRGKNYNHRYAILRQAIFNVHELAITQTILATIVDEAEAAKAKTITSIDLVVGELSGVVTDCVQFYFDILKKDTIARDAQFNFTHIPARFRCRDCSTEFKTEDSYWVCPKCKGINIELIEGRDCYIESIEVD